MKKSLVLLLALLTLSFCTKTQFNNEENRSYFHEIDLNFSKHTEKWYVSIRKIGGKNPTLFYDDIEKVKDITSSQILNYPNDHSTLECRISIINNNNKDIKSFSFFNKKNTVQIIDSSKYQMGGIYTLEDVPHPYSSIVNAKLVTCKIGDTIHTPVYYYKQKMKYPNDGITLILEYYNLKNKPS